MKKWDFIQSDSSKVKELAQSQGISPLLAQILINRNLKSSQEVSSFLHQKLKDLPSPFLMKDMEKASDRLLKAILENEKILVYGDYDVDGTCGTSLFVLFFREIGVPIDYYIPHRVKEGYSLNKTAIDKIYQKGISLIITVDNGISAVEEIDYINELGMDCIITDHHQVPQKRPAAFSICNPHQSDCDFPDKGLCGTAVAFYLLMALRQKLRESGFFAEKKEPGLRNLLPLVALATVADVMPLQGLNRLFVKQGLAEMGRTTQPGFLALFEVSKINPKKVKSYDLGFRLGPRINACGRLYDASLGVQLLTSQSQVHAQDLAKQADQANQERRQLESSILDQASEMLVADSDYKKKMSFVLASDQWHEGVIGIVASRLVEKFRRPVILLKKEKGHLKGSARSLEKLNLIEALGDCSDYLLKYGGHKVAGGLQLLEENFEKFKEAFETACIERLSEEDCLPQIKIDASLSPSDLSFQFLEELQVLEPFGQKNPRPLFVLEKQKALSSRCVGKNHLKFSLKNENQKLEAIAFGLAEQKKLCNDSVDIAFALEKNDYRGDVSLSLNVRDIRKSEAD